MGELYSFAVVEGYNAGMEDPYVFVQGALTFDLSFDEERGGYWGRWHCRGCGKDGIEEKTCSSEDEALASARYGAGLHERSHGRKKKPG